MPKDNTTKYIILGLLNHEDLSGYDIKKIIDRQISLFWNAGYGQIYPTLAASEAEGLITKISNLNTHKKSLYKITQKGQAALSEWLSLPEQKEYTKYEILLKLFFSGKQPLINSLERISRFKESQSANLTLLKGYKQSLEAVIGEDRDHLFFYLTVLFGEKVYAAYAEWAEQAEKLLKNFEIKEKYQ